MKIFDKTTDALAASLNFRSLRQNITSSNIANAETPGYHAKQVDFEEALTRALDLEGMNKESGPDDIAMGSGAISSARADISENPEANITNDGNTVDLEKEMSNQQENSILYKAALQLINKKLGSMKYAITEGGK